MDQAALEARIAELQKQYPGLKFMGRSMKEKNRSRVDEDTGRTVTETVSVPVVEWRDPTTGYTLTAEVGPGGGTYTVTEDRLIPGNKGDAERGSQPPKEEPNPADPTRMRRWNPQTSQWEDAGPNQAEIERRQKAEAERNKPQTVATNTSEPYIVTRQPDGTLKSEPNPNYKGPEPKPGTILTIKGQDGKTYLVPVDAQGNPGPARDSGVPGEKPIPGNAPVFTPDQNEADLGLTAYARIVRQRTDLSKEQQDQLIREAHGTAQTVISRQISTINTQEGTRTAEINQRGQDMSQANARLSAANNVYGSAIQQAAADTKYSTGADAMAVAPYYLMLGQAAAQMFGGLQNTPRVQNGPAIQAVQQQGLPTVSQVLATAPGNPVAPAIDPAAAASAEAARQQQIRANPVFRPTPPVAGAAPSPAPPVPPAQQPQSPGVPGMMMPNSPTIDPSPSPATAPLPPQAQGPNPAINPVTGEPTGLPQAPVAGEPFVGGRVLPQPEPAPVVVPPSEAPAPWQPAPAPAPSGGAFPPLPVIPRAGTEAGGNVQKVMPVQQNPVAMALGVGPWQQQPQGQQPGGMVGTQLMAANGAYDPASVNDEWLAAGADPAIVSLFGGGRRAVA